LSSGSPPADARDQQFFGERQDGLNIKEGRPGPAKTSGEHGACALWANPAGPQFTREGLVAAGVAGLAATRRLYPTPKLVFVLVLVQQELPW
jgi:hypothetical protein